MEFKSLPDIASQSSSTGKSAQNFSGIAWVGMEKIQMPIRWQGQILAAEIRAQVNLKAGTSRGIHMSRLYSLLSESLTSRDLSWTQLETLAQAFIESQGEISQAARVTVKFQLPLEKKALKSELKGWRLYPVEMDVVRTCFSSAQGKNTKSQRRLSTEILYSSTCPASTALSRELWRNDFNATFAAETALTHQGIHDWFEASHGMPGTPHAQRSLADVSVEIADSASDFGPQNLIEGVEAALQTPVQTAVKRVDEQEFARLNGENTMFCEDAARKVQTWLDAQKAIVAYRAVFEHQESLHPHNAVAEITSSLL